MSYFTRFDFWGPWLGLGLIVAWRVLMWKFNVWGCRDWYRWDWDWAVRGSNTKSVRETE